MILVKMQHSLRKLKSMNVPNECNNSIASTVKKTNQKKRDFKNILACLAYSKCGFARTGDKLPSSGVLTGSVFLPCFFIGVFSVDCSCFFVGVIELSNWWGIWAVEQAAGEADCSSSCFIFGSCFTHSNNEGGWEMVGLEEDLSGCGCCCLL